MNFKLILASTPSGGIGNKCKLPWPLLKKDMEHFKTITNGGVVIMGRKTWESIPIKFRPLSNRTNIVLSSDKDFSVPEGVFKTASFEDTIELCSKLKTDNFFVIGGASIYKRFMDEGYVSIIYLTKILNEFECDTFFKIGNDFIIEDNNTEIIDDNGIRIQFLKLIEDNNTERF